MQDRIKELIEQAGLSQRYGDDIPDGDDVVIADLVTMADLRRFAQDVAKDCAKENDELRGFLVAISDGSLSPNNARNLASELLEQLDAIRARYGIQGA